jgi:Tfp pilus assembly protein PilF
VTILSDKRSRHIVPRWRSSLMAASSRDLDPLKRAVARKAGSIPAAVRQQLAEFSSDPSIGTAADALATAIAAGHPEIALPAAAFIQQHADEAPRFLAEIASASLNGLGVPLGLEIPVATQAAIARLRGLLRIYPRSATMWADLARYQAATGDIDKSKRSMRVSLSLAPDHRWVLRSANRLLLHAGDFRQAHHLLASHRRTREDPWLMAAEIASAQLMQVTPKFLSRGRDLLRHPTFQTIHLSELATAVATSDIDGGQRKSARRLLRIAMKDPTENALAQIEWADHKADDGLHVIQTVNRMPDAFEAAFWVKRQEGQIIDAYRAAQAWMADEPFADAPIGAAAHCAALLDEYDEIVRITNIGLSRDSGNLLHRNNQVFALISSGRVWEDDAEFERIAQFLSGRVASPGLDMIQVAANIGLLLYRAGQLDDGAMFYRRAIELADRHAGAVTAAQAAAYHLREAALARAPWVNEALEVARNHAKRANDGVANFLMRKLEDLVRRPHMANEIFGASAAARYLPRAGRNVAADLKVTMTESGPVLVVPAHLLR